MRVVDVGSAEGYYAVGLALRLPSAEVFAFEASARGRYLCAQLATLNGVRDRVHLLARCTAKRLETVVADETLLVCDCEGCEAVLLDPLLVPSLRRADIIVEVHDFIDPRISRNLSDRFRHSHKVHWVDTEPRHPERWPELMGLATIERQIALSEGRPAPMQWMILETDWGRASLKADISSLSESSVESESH